MTLEAQSPPRDAPRSHAFFGARRAGSAFFQKGTASFLFLLFLAACQTSAPDQCKMAHATDLPLIYRGAHVLTPAVLNGAPTTMMLDTGAQFTVVTKATADRMGLDLQELGGHFTGIGGTRTAYLFYAQSFQVGRLQGKHLPLSVSDFNFGSSGGPVDGLFGSDFLASYDVDLDFPERKAKLFRVITGCTAPRAALEEPLFVAPLVASANARDARPFVIVEIGGKRLHALIDSGAQGTLIFRNAAYRLGLRLGDLAEDPHFHAGGIGPHARVAIRHVMTPMTIGEITISNMPVAILDERSEDGTDMLLGLDFLTHVHAWLSFSSHTLVMQYPPRPSPTLP